MESVTLKSVWRIRKMENNYQLSRIHNYVNGLMSKEDMYALEREALDDPFLQDAIDGYKLQNGVDIKQLSLLQQRLALRVSKQEESRNKRFYSWQRLAIGMAAGVMFITVCSLLLIRYIPKMKPVETKEVVISDVAYEFDAIPLKSAPIALLDGHWQALNQLLNSNYSNSQNFIGTLNIRFDINKDKEAYNIHISGDGFERDEELEDIIRNKIKWNGEKANFLLDVRKISH